MKSSHGTPSTYLIIPPLSLQIHSDPSKSTTVPKAHSRGQATAFSAHGAQGSPLAIRETQTPSTNLEQFTPPSAGQYRL